MIYLFLLGLTLLFFNGMSSACSFDTDCSVGSKCSKAFVVGRAGLLSQQHPMLNLRA